MSSRRSSVKTLSARRLFLFAALFILGATAGAFAAEGRDPYQHFFASGTDDFRAELADAQRDGKKALFVMFEQDGCPGCLYMKEHVLSRPDVQKFYRDHFISFSINSKLGLSRTSSTSGLYASPSTRIRDLLIALARSFSASAVRCTT